MCFYMCFLYESCPALFEVDPVIPMLQVEVKPYVLDDQMCDECQGTRCAGKFAPFFCANVTCLQYYCEYCWASIHSRAGREFHKPLVKEGGDRPRHVPFRWS
ncbi:cytoplasmic polyadenylation element-binding protein 4-like protein [Camelus ferus]|nr:cytoplasmic polyadenylation element-binding protein 4-like protein [Camelus ferus]